MVEWDEFDVSGGAETKSTHHKTTAASGFDDLDREGGMPSYRISRSSIISRSKSKQPTTEKEAAGGRRRRDSWDNPVEETGQRNGGAPYMDEWDVPEEENGAGGIGKIKISREMKEKLMALTGGSK